MSISHQPAPPNRFKPKLIWLDRRSASEVFKGAILEAMPLTLSPSIICVGVFPGILDRAFPLCCLNRIAFSESGISVFRKTGCFEDNQSLLLWFLFIRFTKWRLFQWRPCGKKRKAPSKKRFLPIFTGCGSNPSIFWTSATTTMLCFPARIFS